MTRTAEWHQRVFDAVQAKQDDATPYVVIDGEQICHDCYHVEQEHSIADPKGVLCYGMGSCGNCTECAS